MIDKTKYSDNELQTIYRNMDHITNITYYNIYSLTKGTDKIILKGLDLKNEEHLFVVKVCEICSNLMGKRIYADTSFIDRLKWNWKNRKSGNKIYKAPKKCGESIVNVDTTLSFMRFTLEQLLPGMNFGTIYEEYYSGKEQTNEKN